MSVQSELDRIISAIGAAYDAVEAKGGTVPQSETVAGLAAAVQSIQTGGGGSMNATAGTVTVAADCNDYTLTHGLGEIPQFFFIGMKERFSAFTGKTYILIGVYGFSNYSCQYRISAARSDSAPSGVLREFPITQENTGKISLCKANENTITVAASTGNMLMITGATYYWIAIGSGVFT